MQGGRVCISGYDEAGSSIRPVLPHPGIAEQSLKVNGKAIAFPFATIEIDLLKPRPQPPHTEDRLYQPGSVKFVRELSEEQRRQILFKTSFDNVAAIFEQPIQRKPGYYVSDGQGPRSIGTIQPHSIFEAIYTPGEKGEGDAWDYRLVFYDKANERYKLKITDLAWHYYCDSLRSEDNDPPHIASEVTTLLKSRIVFLRIGLARGWKEFPDRCYLQVTGIHTFPDYLMGKTFADFGSVK
jgi:hypothetical protein